MMNISHYFSHIFADIDEEFRLNLSLSLSRGTFMNNQGQHRSCNRNGLHSNRCEFESPARWVQNPQANLTTRRPQKFLSTNCGCPEPGVQSPGKRRAEMGVVRTVLENFCSFPTFGADLRPKFCGHLDFWKYPEVTLRRGGTLKTF